MTVPKQMIVLSHSIQAIPKIVQLAPSGEGGGMEVFPTSLGNGGMRSLDNEQSMLI